MKSYSFYKNSGRPLLEHALLSNRRFKLPKEKLILKQEGMLEGILRYLNLNIKDINITIKEDQVTIHGQCQSQYDSETAVLLLGNMKGISLVHDVIEGLEDYSPQFYDIKEGDSLSKIAQEYLKDKLLYNEIFFANKYILQDPTSVIPGYKIRIPQKRS